MDRYSVRTNIDMKPEIFQNSISNHRGDPTVVGSKTYRAGVPESLASVQQGVGPRDYHADPNRGQGEDPTRRYRDVANSDLSINHATLENSAHRSATKPNNYRATLPDGRRPLECPSVSLEGPRYVETKDQEGCEYRNGLVGDRGTALEAQQDQKTIRNSTVFRGEREFTDYPTSIPRERDRNDNLTGLPRDRETLEYASGLPREPASFPSGLSCNRDFFKQPNRLQRESVEYGSDLSRNQETFKQSARLPRDCGNSEYRSGLPREYNTNESQSSPPRDREDSNYRMDLPRERDTYSYPNSLPRDRGNLDYSSRSDEDRRSVNPQEPRGRLPYSQNGLNRTNGEEDRFMSVDEQYNLNESSRYNRGTIKNCNEQYHSGHFSDIKEETSLELSSYSITAEVAASTVLEAAGRVEGQQLFAVGKVEPGSIDKSVCGICGDRASGKHYGVYSCEGCKGFFKRTVRKDLQYACRDDRACVVDKRQRNRCQYCRYVKCLNMGMKREAVQEERQRVKKNVVTKGGKGSLNKCSDGAGNPPDPQVGSTTTSANCEMPVELILEAELAIDPRINVAQLADDTSDNPMPTICQSTDRQLFYVVDWAKRIPHFISLPLQDQVILIRAGWNELLIAGFSHRSIPLQDKILLATGVTIHRANAHAAEVGVIFDRILSELVAKMREMNMDRTELGCIKAVVLFNPDAKGLQAVQEIESLREKVYASLEEYCKVQYPDEPGRFAKILLRLPSLRSIGLRFIEHLFFFKLIGDTPLDSFLLEMLDNSAAGS